MGGMITFFACGHMVDAAPMLGWGGVAWVARVHRRLLVVSLYVSVLLLGKLVDFVSHMQGCHLFRWSLKRGISTCQV